MENANVRRRAILVRCPQIFFADTELTIINRSSHVFKYIYKLYSHNSSIPYQVHESCNMIQRLVRIILKTDFTILFVLIYSHFRYIIAQYPVTQ